MEIDTALPEGTVAGRTVDAPDEYLLFNRQFYIGETVPDAFRGWSVIELSGPWKCAAKNLSVNVARSDRGSITILGEILDPERPDADNASVAARLLDLYSAGPPGDGFTAAEAALDGLGGRYVVFANLDGEVRAYPDAFGSRAMVYAEVPGGSHCVASQPGLFEAAFGTQRSQAVEDLGLENGRKWPGTLTPLEGVRSPLPNHYVDVRIGEMRRFWPRESSLEPLGMDATARLMILYYQQLLVAAGHRWPLKIALTAGYDSRLATTMAVTAGVERIETFTQARRTPLPFEWETAERVAAVLGVPHELIKVRRVRKPMRVKRIMRRNGGYANLSGAAFGLNVRETDLLVLSHCDEALRRVELDYETADEIVAYATRRRTNKQDGRGAAAVAEIEGWIAGVPADSWFSLADLYTWELVWGSYLPNKYAGIDTVAPVMAAQNCRDYQLLGFAVSKHLRGPPNRLFRRIFEMLAPELLEIEFNRGAKEI